MITYKRDAPMYNLPHTRGLFVFWGGECQFYMVREQMTVCATYVRFCSTVARTQYHSMLRQAMLTRRLTVGTVRDA